MSRDKHKDLIETVRQRARRRIRDSWLQAGVSELELDQAEQVASLYLQLVHSGICPKTLASAWDTLTPAEILARYASPGDVAHSSG